MLFCEQCGSQIYTRDDLGFHEIREERLSGFYLDRPRPVVRILYAECKACTEEKERDTQAFLASDEYRLEIKYMEMACQGI